MTSARHVERRFPDFGWAWPTGDLDLLLKAVMIQDGDAALHNGLTWLSKHNIDDVNFREKRLLAALSERFGKRLSTNPAHPRLMGLQRMLWSRSRMALRDTTSALKLFEEASIPFMLLKGASRIAVESGAQRGRISHDIDVLVPQSHILDAYKLLLKEKWEAASGAGAARLEKFAETLRATNFIKGDFGDLDVHRLAYHPAQNSDEDDRELWNRSLEAQLEGITTRVPSPSDRIALSIAHGALDSHTHSDWLCDIDSCLRAGNVNWDELLTTLQRRNLIVPAASALSYLAQEIGSPVARYFLLNLIERADGASLKQRVALFECKPKTDLGPIGIASRGVVKQFRLWRGKRLLPKMQESITPVYSSRPAAANRGAISSHASVALNDELRHASELEIVIDADLPKIRRRIDWELSLGHEHLTVLRHRKLNANRGWKRLTFIVDLPTVAHAETLKIQARPSRLLRGSTDPTEIARCGAIPFRLVSIRSLSECRTSR